MLLYSAWGADGTLRRGWVPVCGTVRVWWRWVRWDGRGRREVARVAGPGTVAILGRGGRIRRVLEVPGEAR